LQQWSSNDGWRSIQCHIQANKQGNLIKKRIKWGRFKFNRILDEKEIKVKPYGRTGKNRGIETS
jgi:hypothetical protein